MEKEFFEHCEAWFNDYVARYVERAGPDMPLVERKQRHTLRVLDHAEHILQEAAVSETLVRDVRLGALLHDVGRFPQLVRHKSYDDHTGYNHAEAGAEILGTSGLLDSLEPERREVVLTTVRLHNLAVLPEGLTPDTRTALEIVRDADKLDAFRNNLIYLHPDGAHGKALKAGLTWHATEVTPALVDLAANRRLIPFTAINWSNDYILFLCCWIYDLHYTYAYRQLRESGNYMALMDKLPDDALLGPVKAQLAADFERMADGAA